MHSAFSVNLTASSLTDPYPIARAKKGVELSHKGSSCHECRLVSSVVLSQGSNCHEVRVISWVELSVLSCHKGRDEL